MQIGSQEELQNISTGDFKLTDDIHISEDFSTIQEFDGTLNGQGYEITGLKTQFIHTVLENSTIKNISFKNINLTNEKGIFNENRGVVKSISVVNFNQESTGEITSEDGCGGIVYKNQNTIKNCTVSDSTIRSGENVGGVCGLAEPNSQILGCAVTSLDVKAVEKNVGGIVGKTDDTEIRNCKLTDSHLNGANSVGGISGKSKNSTFENLSIFSSKLVSDYMYVAGVVSEGCPNQIKNCTVKKTKIVGNLHIRGICHGNKIRDEPDIRIENSCVKNCTILQTSTNPKQLTIPIKAFSGEGIVKNSYITNTKIKGKYIYLDTDSISFKNSYINLEICSENTDTVDLDNYTSGTIYVDITSTTRSEPKTVQISDPEDLHTISTTDTVELSQDIDLSEHTIKKDIFRGTFDGKGYTISNLNGALFNEMEGKIKNVTIQNSNRGRALRSSYVAQKIQNSTIENVTITQTNTTEYNSRPALAHIIVNSTIRDCNISLTGQHNLYGVSERVEDSHLEQLNIELNITNCKQGAGISHKLVESDTVKCTTTGKSILTSNGQYGGLAIENGMASEIKYCICDSTIYISKSDKSCSIGGIVLRNNGIITNCTFTGVIQSNTKIITEDNIGGIVAVNHSLIQNSTNKGLINVRAKITGGITAQSVSGTIRNCSNTVPITGGVISAGIAGKTVRDPLISNSQNTGNISGLYRAGGLVGLLKTETTVKRSYNNSNVISYKNYEPLIAETTDDEATLTNLYWIQHENINNSNYGTQIQNPDAIKTILNV